MRTTPRLPPRKPEHRPLSPADDAGVVLTPWDARGDVVVYRLPRTQSMGEAVERIRAALALAAVDGGGNLVVDVRGFEGESPGMAARHEYIRSWAAAAEGRLRVAMVMQPRYLDPERFGVVVAANFGLETETFTDDEDAVRWLREGIR